MIIAVDVDDTVAQLMPEWLRLYNKKFDRNVQVEDIVDWECSCIPPEDKENFYSILHARTLYDHVEPVYGALDGCMTLRELGHRVVFITSVVPAHAGAKLLWLYRHGFLVEKRHGGESNYIECFDKALIRADLIIEDKPATVLTFPAHAILLTTPANRAWEVPRHTTQDRQIIRVESWKAIPYYVEYTFR